MANFENVEKVERLLKINTKVLVTDINTVEVLKQFNYRVTPKYEYRPSVSRLDKLEMKQEFIGYMVEN